MVVKDEVEKVGQVLLKEAKVLLEGEKIGEEKVDLVVKAEAILAMEKVPIIIFRGSNNNSILIQGNLVEDSVVKGKA